jgi:hypothetical protein
VAHAMPFVGNGKVKVIVTAISLYRLDRLFKILVNCPQMP